jgi:cell division septation protein DedD
VQSDHLAGWYVFEASADEAVIRNVDDPLSAVRLSQGTVLGNLGFVSEIRIENGRAKVVLSNGDVILSDDSATIQTETEAPEPSEPRRGPPFEIAIASVQLEPQEVPAADPVASDVVEPVAAPAAPVVAAQTPSTKSVQERPVGQSGADAGRYVQVATFKSVANAQIAKNMVMSDGMTGELRKTTLNGASYHRVLAGPFDPAEIQTALSRVARLGFRDAFIIR